MELPLEMKKDIELKINRIIEETTRYNFPFLASHDKKKEIINLFNIPNIYKNEIRQYIDMFASLCSGMKFELSKIDDKFSESEISSICFSDQNYEEIKDALSNLLDDTFTIVDIAKNIFDFVSLKTLIGDSKFLSEAYIKIYDLHKKQLKDLNKKVNCKNKF